MKYDIKNLTLEQKLRILAGKNEWELNDLDGAVRDITVNDGPNGLRRVVDGKTIPSTAMPNIHVVANSWNRELAYLDGETIANDCIEQGTDVLLAPGVNVKRTPLCARNFEYFSEDPFLAGELASEYINGVQDKGVGACIKHFALNNKEYERHYQSSEVDERTAREIYFKPFEIAIKKSAPLTLMCSYNKVNGVYASENKWLLSDILRDELGFDGVVISDWDAVKNSYKATKASLDLEMPYHDWCYRIRKDAYDKGLLTEQEIDACVQRILTLMERLDDIKDKRKINYSKIERHENAVKIAKEGIVLLKNDGVLPIKSGNNTVITQYSFVPPIGGGGSAHAITDYKSKSLTELLNEKTERAKFEFVNANYQQGLLSVAGSRAVKKAIYSDVNILCLNTFNEGEGSDREEIRLPIPHENLILDIAKVNPNLVVCLFAGSAVDMSRWIDKVKGVIYVGFAGEGVLEALSDIIVGKTCPSGKLSETFPLSIEDTVTGQDYGNAFLDVYYERLNVGYRYYDALEKDVLFPFGYGLSYANFTYSNLRIEKKGDVDFTISYDITNNSDIPAKEISQVYVKELASFVYRPEKELKGFSKDLIGAWETKTVSVELDFNSFAFYSQPLKRWQVQNGAFEIMVGSSSRDIHLTKKVEIELPDQTQASQDYDESLW